MTISTAPVGGPSDEPGLFSISPVDRLFYDRYAEYPVLNLYANGVATILCNDVYAEMSAADPSADLQARLSEGIKRAIFLFPEEYVERALPQSELLGFLIQMYEWAGNKVDDMPELLDEFAEFGLEIDAMNTASVRIWTELDARSKFLMTLGAYTLSKLGSTAGVPIQRKDSD